MLPKITKELIESISTDSSYCKGIDYYEDGAVLKITTDGERYQAKVEGYDCYTVTITGSNGQVASSCTCPYDWGGACKHIVAVMLAILKDNRPEKYKKEFDEVTAALENVDLARLKEFLRDILSKNDEVREEFLIFSCGEKETDKSVEGYKSEILQFFSEIEPCQYFDDYGNNEYHSPIDEIIDRFTDVAKQYNRWGNFKEEIKIYQAVYEACIEAIDDKGLEDLYDDIFYSIEPALESMADSIGNLDSFNKRKEYFDYLIKRREFHTDRDLENIDHVFVSSVVTAEDVDYLLSIKELSLSPVVKFELLMIKGETEEIINFGEAHYLKHPEITLPLSELYLKQENKEKAVETAEKGLETLKKKHKLSRGIDRNDQAVELRKFLDELYDKKKDYKKITENLTKLILLELDIEYYKRLKETLNTKKEKSELVEKLSVMLKGFPETLFKIYSIEEDYERLLSLMKSNADDEIFHSIVSKIKDKYPRDCYELYKKKIDKLLEPTAGRKMYRQAARWLSLMKQIPDYGEEFKRYVNQLRTKYKIRRALIDELKGI